jgi:hypothetical protein
MVLSSIVNITMEADRYHLYIVAVVGIFAIGILIMFAYSSRNNTISEVRIAHDANAADEAGQVISSTCTDTCASKGYTCGVQSLCGARVSCGTCSSGKICSSGKCIASYTDSDGGYNYNVTGSLTWYPNGVKYVNKDYCSGSYLTEFGCVSGSSVSKVYTCPNGCSNGACIVTQNSPSGRTINIVAISKMTDYTPGTIYKQISAILAENPKTDIFVLSEFTTSASVSISCGQGRYNCVISSDSSDVLMVKDLSKQYQTNIFLPVTTLSDGITSTSGVILFNKDGQVQTYFHNSASDPLQPFDITTRTGYIFRTNLAICGQISRFFNNAKAGQNLDLFIWAAAAGSDVYSNCVTNMLYYPNTQYESYGILKDNGYIIKSNSANHNEGCIMNPYGKNKYYNLKITTAYTYVTVQI